MQWVMLCSSNAFVLAISGTVVPRRSQTESQVHVRAALLMAAYSLSTDMSVLHGSLTMDMLRLP